MTGVELGSLLNWFLLGALVGAWVTVTLLWHFGFLDRKVTVEVTPAVTLDWSVINAAVQGEGYMLVAKPESKHLH